MPGLFDDVLKGGDTKGLFDDVLSSPKKQAQGYDEGEKALLDALGYNDAPTNNILDKAVGSKVGKFVTQVIPESAKNAGIGAVMTPIHLGKKVLQGDVGGAAKDFVTGTGGMIAQGLGVYNPRTGEMAGSNPIPEGNPNDPLMGIDFQLNPQGTLQQIGNIAAENYSTDPVGSALGLASAIAPMKMIKGGDLPIIQKVPKKATLAEPEIPLPEALAEVIPEVPSFDSMIPQVKGGSTKPLGKYAEGSAINLEKLDTPLDVKQTLNDLTKRNEDVIGKQRVTWEETRRQAEELGWDVDDLKKAWEKKGAFSAAEMDATRQMNVNAITDLQESIRNLPPDVTTLPPEIRAKVLDAIDLIKVTSQASSEAGRALNIHKKALANDPAFIETANFNKALKNLGDVKNDILIDKLGDIDFADTASVNKLIYDATTPKWKKLSDGAYEMWLNGLLSNPLTHVKNITSNAMTYLYTLPERAIATGIDAIRAGVTKSKREVFLGEGAQEIFSWNKGLMDAWGQFGEAMKKGDSVNKMELQRVSPIPEQIQKFTPTRALSAEDAFFKGFIQNSELNRLAFRKAKKEGLSGSEFTAKVQEILQNPSKDMIEAVYSKSKELTFQQELGKIGSWIMQGRDRIPGLKYIIPFIKTPTNIMKFSLERTPVGFGMLAKKAMKNGLTGAELSEGLAKPIMGTMLGVTLYQLADQGFFTGGVPKDKKQRDEKLATGWQPYSFKVGSTYYGMQNIEPLATIFGLAADANQAINEKADDAYEKMAQFMTAISRNVTDKTFMQGIGNIIQAISQPEQKLKTWVTSLSTSVVPAVAGGVARSMDDTVRDAKTIPDALKARVPGLSHDVPARLTVWGDEIKRQGNPVSRFISPVPISEEMGSPIERETAKMDFDPGYPSRKLKVGNMKVDLDPDEYWGMVQEGRKPAKQLLDALAQSATWKGKSDDEKAQDIKYVTERFMKPVKNRLIMKLLTEQRLNPVTDKDYQGILNHLE